MAPGREGSSPFLGTKYESPVTKVTGLFVVGLFISLKLIGAGHAGKHATITKLFKRSSLTPLNPGNSVRSIQINSRLIIDDKFMQRFKTHNQFILTGIGAF